MLAAVVELLGDAGYDELSIEAVAERAGVHKTTVYRRWPTKAALVADAVRANSEEHVLVPDTGSLVGDLEAFALAIADNIGTPAGGRRSRSIVAASAASSELATEMSDFWMERFRASAVIIERAVARGEAPRDVDPQLVIETLIGPLWVRLLLTGGTIDRHLATDVARLVADGIEGR